MEIKIIKSGLIPDLEFHITNEGNSVTVKLFGKISAELKKCYVSHYDSDFIVYMTDVPVRSYSKEMLADRCFSKDELINGLFSWDKELFEYLETVKRQGVTKTFMNELPDSL